MYLRLLPAKTEPEETTRLRVASALEQMGVAARVSPHPKGGFSVSASDFAPPADLADVLSQNGLISVI